MQIKTRAEIKNNQIILYDKEIFEKFSQGQQVYVTIEDVQNQETFVGNSETEKLRLIKKLNRFSKKSRILTPDTVSG